MEHLWAPWRIQYIKAAPPDHCVFCALPADGRDREHHILHRGPHAFVMLNRFPYTSGHLMVVPYRHIADLDPLDDPEALDVFHLTTAAMEAIRQIYGPQGFNVGVNIGRAAGAGIVDHVHVHVVPRWVGDTNFMPVLGDVKVLPEELAVTYDRLAPAIGAALARRLQGA